MNILITGGAGFIGVNLTRKLLQENNKVTVVDNFITSNRSNIKKLSGNNNLEIIECDISKNLPDALYVKKFEQIFHLACPTGVPNLTKLAEEMLLTCSQGTKNILDLALKNKSSVMFASSSEVYGEPKEFPQKESYTGNVSTTGIRSPYEEGKRFSESLVMSYMRKFKLNTKIVRLFNTYGPEMSIYDSRVIPATITSAFSGRPIVIYGKGLQRRTFLYVDDLVEAFLTVINNRGPQFLFNLGSDREISILELVQVILSLIKSESKIEFKSRPEHDHSGRLPSLKRIRSLGWEIRTNLKTGLRKTIDWVINNN